MRKSIRATLTLGVLIGGITAAVIAPVIAAPASAEDNYNCPGHGKCATINGSEEDLDYNEGYDYEVEGGGETCSTIWKNNGGGNYSVVNHACYEYGTSYVCSGTVYGHGEVTSPLSGGVLAGHQDDYGNGRC
jgi:hypothetical protein